MRGFLIRMLYAVVCVVLFWFVFPLFLEVLSLPLTGPVLQLLHILIACIALLYVFFGPAPPEPWKSA